MGLIWRSITSLALYHFADARLMLPAVSERGAEVVAIDLCTPDQTNLVARKGKEIYPMEAHAVFKALSGADQERLRRIEARKEVEPAFWDRLERPESPMALVLWAISHPRVPASVCGGVGRVGEA